MFFELIYTRCGSGIDFQKNGKRVENDGIGGYKVFSCSRDLLDGTVTDNAMLYQAAQQKQSFEDPSFMDDAYLYYVPDNGEPFFTLFHPIPFDDTEQSDYNRRPGNYINQILVGRFAHAYPFEAFGNAEIWYAKERGERYYYFNEPTDLPVRTDIDTPDGVYLLDEISDFIHDGREEALKKAVAFLIAQYAEKPENRKYLVISDENTRAVELWIAAIELAFSPRMAMGLPFATRMVKFDKQNKYTVNDMGAYQNVINLQDPKQHMRLYAMIVGVVAADRENAGSVRTAQNMPYAVLDGIQKAARFEADTDDSYYDLITQFNEEHEYFCRTFAEEFSYSAPTPEILKLCRVYRALTADHPEPREFSEALAMLNAFKIRSPELMSHIYRSACRGAEQMLKKNPLDAFSVIGWISQEAPKYHDEDTVEMLRQQIGDAVKSQIYAGDVNAAAAIWGKLKEADIAQKYAWTICDPDTLRRHEAALSGGSAAYLAEVMQIYLEAEKLSGSRYPENIRRLAYHTATAACSSKDRAAMDRVYQSAADGVGQEPAIFWGQIAQKSTPAIADFIVSYQISLDPSVLSTKKRAVEFCQELTLNGCESAVGTVMGSYVSKSVPVAELCDFLTDMDKLHLSDEALCAVQRAADKKLPLTAKGTLKAAKYLQMNLVSGATLPHSAHILVLALLRQELKAGSSFSDMMQQFAQQGFPSLEDPDYAEVLSKAIADCGYKKERGTVIAYVLRGTPLYPTTLMKYLLAHDGVSDYTVLQELLAAAAKHARTREQSMHCLTQALAESKLSKHAAERVLKKFSDDEAADFLREAITAYTGDNGNSSSGGGGISGLIKGLFR